MFQSLIKRSLLLVLLAFVGGASSVFAEPKNVSVTPPNGARFLVGQRFDLRVEGEGRGKFRATLEIDGKPQRFTSGEQNSIETDGISKQGYGGFNLRGYSNASPGTHTITATFSDETGTVSISAKFQIIDVRGRFKPAKNIIIMLGDGMGVAHRSAARLVRYGATGGTPNGFLAMDQFPGTGLVTTYSLNSIVTDSSPGMACYSTGNHADNNQEGVFPANVKNPFYAPRVEYMAEYLHRNMGKSLGIVTTADVEDATPAANAVHTSDRNAGMGICDQYLDESDQRGTRKYGTGLTVLMGGGRRWFLPKGHFGSSRETSKEDRPIDYEKLPKDIRDSWGLPEKAAGALDPNRDLLKDFKDAGFTYVDTFRTGRNALTAAGTPNKLLGLFAYGNMNTAMDKIAKRRKPAEQGVVDDYQAPDQPMLDEMTEAALRVLNKNGNGFVLLVEGAHIDKQSHLMDADRVIDEVIEFDRAVAVARNFADKAGDTIIVVVADHECSGFSVIGALKGGKGSMDRLENLPPDNETIDPKKRPERQQAVGVYEEANFPKYTILADGYPETFDIDGKILFGFGANSDRYETWRQKTKPVIDSLLPDDLKEVLRKKGYANQPHQRESDAKGFFIRGQLYETRGQTAVHTATDVPISAYSSTSQAYQLFYGVQENTDIFFKLMRAVLGGSK
jgi:alkaline phosphatase